VQIEPFAPVITVLRMPGGEEDGAAYLARCVDFANTKCWGTLTSTLILHPEFEKKHPEAVQKVGARGVGCCRQGGWGGAEWAGWGEGWGVGRMAGLS
jgi:hypothetical protein